MSELQLQNEATCHGLRALSLENRYLRLMILPEAGAKIWQITYKPFEADLLWNNSRIPPAKLPMISSYDDVWSGGWDELFPNDEVATIAGREYPDHGELWTGEWSACALTGESEKGWKLEFQTPLSSIRVEKTIVLRRDDPRIYFRHRFTNLGSTPFPFLWKLHPAMNVSANHRLDFPPMRVILEPAFPGTLEGAPIENSWPLIELDHRRIDLRCIPDAAAQQLYFFYGAQMQDGWCALTNTSTGLACGWRFDPAVFPCCWLFATYGGWRDYNVAVLEPCTGYPLSFAAMQAAGRQRTLAPGESLQTDVLFSVQENMRSVGCIDAEGRMRQGG